MNRMRRMNDRAKQKKVKEKGRRKDRKKLETLDM